MYGLVLRIFLVLLKRTLLFLDASKGTFFFRAEDTHAQGEFLSYPKGKHDDVMDAIWTALDRAKPSRIKDYDKDDDYFCKPKKRLDWMTL